MPTITRENVRIRLRLRGADTSDFEFHTYAGTLAWDTDAQTLDLTDPVTGAVIVALTEKAGNLGGNMVMLKDVPFPARFGGVYPEADGALESLQALGVIKHNPRVAFEGLRSAVTLSGDLGAADQEACTRTATVTLFKPSGKYHMQAAWRVPVAAVGPDDMVLSPDYQSIDGGAVLVDADASEEYPDAENWGYPHLLSA